MKKHHLGQYSVGFIRQGQHKQLIVKKCVSMIEQLQLELERANKINQEQKQLIQILKEGKQYYQKQCKLNTFQQRYIQIQQQNQRLQMQVQIQKKTEDQLKHKLNKIQVQKENLLKASKEKDQKNQVREQKYMKLLLQKEIIQKEWNKVIRAVKKKISILVANNESNPQKSPIKPFIAEIEKQNQNKMQKTNLTTVAVNYVHTEGKLIKRAQNMVKMIDNMLAVQQLENILTGDTTNKKSEQRHKQFSGQRALRQIDLNRPEVPFNIQFY